MTLFQKRVSDSSFDRARTVTYTPPTFGNRCSSMLKVTLPRKPVPPIRKIFRPMKISVGESLAVMIQIRSVQFTRSLGAVMLQQIGNRLVVFAQRDIERGAGARQGIDIRTANQEFLDD